MATATLTSKGQITIPIQIRTSLGITVGDRIEFIAEESGKVTIMAATHSVKDLKGLVHRPDRPVSIEDMDRAIGINASAAR
ncbi:AbrB/MazE/SpoVT family DNA-binding domain-containing protein [Candidatus Fukatsuia symbiotica]|uniref:AbrB family transcriptional regulator n=1 Tax=Candidatus Fukatsuia symbiotica TaxID=1878942 RepID=A0A2U8I636_9GAMM|nr:AbrB/MazE/SpoVT family DNA-binding domain-containing protein [Candidatus Fukatsuia symbiotica]AWK14557.1 AbrB family transcriptional regulator [Candidatus Fukatsuia symbiotica]MEA9444855.1 AbrB/MazE/SpoVT family DNA-binding domain-containing protein [Candidatus Fukatsuia symbiotica]